MIRGSTAPRHVRWRGMCQLSSDGADAPSIVITGLVPVIYVLVFWRGGKDVDGRGKPGHDERRA